MEMGRTTTCRVSAYTRGRVHECRLITGESRTLTADFNGAMPVGVTIASVRWRMDLGSIAAMSGAAISTDKRSTSVTLAAVWIGCTMLICTATLSNGDVLTQMFSVDVSGNPYFLPASTTPGSLELTA